MKRHSAIFIAALFLSAGSAWAKLPPPSEEAQAKAEEAKVKAADAAKKDAEDLGKAQDRVAERYIREQKAKGVIVKPNPITPPPAAATAPPPPAVPVAVKK